MKCVIIYHSKFGNNKQLCEALGEDLEKDMEVKCLFVDEASVDDVIAADLVIIGGPTHVLRASRSMRKFLKELSKSKEEFSGKKAIAYGTKVKMGSAAKSIEKKLRKSYRLRNRMLLSDKNIERLCIFLNILPKFVLKRLARKLHY